MYQARRIAETASLEQDGAAAFVIAPRRAARSRSHILRTRVAPTAVSVALLATSGAFALNLRAADESAVAVPAAPVREVDTISRDTVRELAAIDEAPAAAAADQEQPAQETPDAQQAPEAQQAQEPAEGAPEFVSGSWATVFGAPAGSKFVQANTVVRAQASGDAATIGSLKSGDEISVTDKVEGKFRQVAFDGKVGYVLESRLGDAAPVKEAPKATKSSTARGSSNSGSSATDSTSNEQTSSSASYDGPTTYSGKTVLGLKPKAMVVYNAVTERWSFSSIGGYRATNNRSNHGRGGAIDFMLTPGKDSAKGWAVANYLAANASAFQIDHIIFEQKIWTPYKPHWRPMANRGSVTANHYDHVHVSVKL